MVSEYISRARAKTLKIKKEFQKHTTTAIIAAFGFLIALSWRDFVSDAVNKIIQYLGVEEKSYLLKLLSAVIVTILAIVGILLVSKFKINEETKQNISKKSKTKTS